MKRIFGKLLRTSAHRRHSRRDRRGVHARDRYCAQALGRRVHQLIKMLLAPVIFLTVVTGIAKMENMKELGRVGLAR